MKNSLMKPTLLLDMDGPIAYLAERVIEIMSDEYGILIDVPENETWEESEEIGPATKKLIYEVMNRPGFSRNLDVVDGAIEGVKLLQDYYEVVILTAPMDNNHNASDKMFWARKHFPNIDDVILTKRKDLVYGDVLIDDRVSNLIPWTNRFNGTGVLYPMRYNSGYIYFDRIGWEEGLVDLLTHEMELLCR